MPQRRELHDRYFKKAKAEGYAARSAYKLLEINERRSVMRKGDRVLDLGCAPGSWLQVAAKLVGASGVVVGLDLQKVTIALPETVRTLEGDIFATEPEVLTGGEPFDTILSDMAPSTTGAGDHYRSVALCRRVMTLLPGLLRPGGNLVMKVFEGEEYPALLRETQREFLEVKGLKPDATREVSKEMYVIARGYQGRGGTGPGKDAAGKKLAPRGGPPKPAPGWGGKSDGGGS